MKRKDFLKYLGLTGAGLLLSGTKKLSGDNSRLLHPTRYYDAEYTYDSSLKKHVLTKVTYVKGFNGLPWDKRMMIRGAISQTLEPGVQYYPG